MACSKGPQVESNPGLLRRGPSLCIWGACSTDSATRRPQFCTFNGSNGETPLPMSKASKTHPKIFTRLHLYYILSIYIYINIISNTLRLHVVTMHIHNAIKTLTLWAKTLRNKLSGCRDTAPWTQPVSSKTSSTY